MSNTLKIAILSPVCQLGGMFAGGAIGTFVHGALPGHTLDLGRILPAAFFALFGLLAGGALWGMLIARFSGSSETRRGAGAGAIWAISALAIALALTPIEVALVEQAGSPLPLRNLFTLLFVPAVFIVCFVTAWTMSVALRRRGREARNALLTGLACAGAFLVVNILMDALGWQVGAPRAAERFTMLTVAFGGCLAASAALGGALQIALSRSGASAPIALQ
ncbi:MAG TPA: hypothetical protein PLG23_06175 [Thermoflexales bacterium]|jgi:hypothetical protein|nr:hypothetical protein [Thermoflexales bacterium]HQX10216.1 hypothetical protein [Thermoflexales bacterium]HQY26969.1 hypothetical protein [Thermoflexales bacterium]HQZ53030.1 hypothetical protein [Thermoflexales bacterium]HRA54030.1 hypothetical protein [Thermoflexales bacterium]